MLAPLPALISDGKFSDLREVRIADYGQSILFCYFFCVQVGLSFIRAPNDIFPLKISPFENEADATFTNFTAITPPVTADCNENILTG